tara:strand:+ start:462 stop:1316 length:855 start_codon:yes stop_codon:yes gene_type:complete
MKSCIFCLARGHPTIDGYKSLRKRNQSLRNNFYDDMIIFHEGNITPEHQTLMSKETNNLKFIKVSFNETEEKQSLHQLCHRHDDDFLNKSSHIKNYESVRKGVHFPIGYSHMCNFYTVDWIQYLDDYDWAMRADDDFFIEPNELDSSIFHTLDSHGFKFGYRVIDCEYHCHSVKTFDKLQEFIPNYSYNMEHYYSNFGIFKLDFWRQTHIRDLLDKLTPFIFEFRWGDSPLQAAIIKSFLENKEICFIDTFNYTHGSHNLCTKMCKRFSHDTEVNLITKKLDYL